MPPAILAAPCWGVPVHGEVGTDRTQLASVRNAEAGNDNPLSGQGDAHLCAEMQLAKLASNTSTDAGFPRTPIADPVDGLMARTIVFPPCARAPVSDRGVYPPSDVLAQSETVSVDRDRCKYVFHRPLPAIVPRNPTYEHRNGLAMFRSRRIDANLTAELTPRASRQPTRIAPRPRKMRLDSRRRRAENWMTRTCNKQIRGVLAANEAIPMLSQWQPREKQMPLVCASGCVDQGRLARLVS
jgi:hypothetical protein